MADEKSSLPVKQTLLDRQALERVLARAAELQGTGSMPDSTDLLSETQLRDIGKDVGLSPATISQALAEERTRINVPEERGLVAQIAGAGFATATRTIAGTPREVLASIDTWMSREECLQVQRRFADRITWEPQRGLFGKLKRTVNISGRAYYLVDAREISATVLPVDANRVVVRLDADIHPSRARRVGLGGLVVGAGGVFAGLVGLTLVIAHLPLFVAAGAALVPLAGGTAGAYKVARSHRTVLSSVQLALEQVLDRLEHGELGRPSLMDTLASIPRFPRQ
ncbi:MAG: hypothetical protein ACR2NS_10000 [Gemmatimonadaceae bacterium]